MWHGKLLPVHDCIDQNRAPPSEAAAIPSLTSARSFQAGCRDVGKEPRDAVCGRGNPGRNKQTLPF
jgi:hypothetical protein